MSYRVKEVFFTLQGEGANTGRPCVFVRFSGCNLWSGREEDRAKAPGSCGRWCDTDFRGGTPFETPALLAAAAITEWRQATGQEREANVVFTGGEPLLQIDSPLIDAFLNAGFEWIAVETNGTVKTKRHWFDWITVSPKAGQQVVLEIANECKIVWPQEALDPMAFTKAPYCIDHFYVQPMDGPNKAANVEQCIAYVTKHPKFSLSLQTHKILRLR